MNFGQFIGIMAVMRYSDIKFITSVFKLNDLPSSSQELAFVGRSNSGKSSAINAITGVTGLAKTSKTPGRTQAINFFQLAEHKYLVDLPGYGFANVPTEVKQRWQQTIQQYIATRESLVGVVQLMDIRHPLKELDLEVLHWMSDLNLPVHILLTKADKLKRGPAKVVQSKVVAAVEEYPEVTVQTFSVKQPEAIKAARNVLQSWLAL